jgi:hypothetical protein
MGADDERRSFWERSRRRQPEMSGKAVASLICALLGLVTCGLTGIPALLLGIWALVEINRSGGRLKGEGLALAGTIVSGLEVLLLPIAVISAALVLPAVQSAREAGRRTADRNHLVEIGIALHGFHGAFAALPDGTAEKARHLPVDQRLSWVASILPFLEHGRLYDALAFDEPWDGPRNRPATSQALAVLQNPALAQVGNRTHYVGMAGVGADAASLPDNDPRSGLFGYQRRTNLQSIADGPSNTIMTIGVADRLGPWAQGGFATVRGLTAQPYFNGPDGFGGFRQGLHVGMADGSVRFIAGDIDSRVLESLATKAGGEPVQAPP